MRHGDLTSWNSVWADDRLVGVIDWDLAIPGEALDDLAQLAWYSVPLRLPDRQRRVGYGAGVGAVGGADGEGLRDVGR
ncbi:phosphotransferase [Streptomyces sp. NPDC005921]